MIKKIIKRIRTKIGLTNKWNKIPREKLKEKNKLRKELENSN